MNLFGFRKKENIDAYRKRGEEILAVLGDAEVELNKKRKVARDSENEELLSKLNEYASELADIRRKLNNAEACDLDTILIDKKLSQLGTQLIDAVHNDKIEITGYIIASIGYGVKNGRVKICTRSLDIVDTIMKSRERIMERYELIIRSSKEIDHARCEMKKLEKALREVEETLEEGKIKLKELKEAVHDMEVKNPGIIQASQTVRVGTNPNPLVSTYMSLNDAGASLFKSLKDLKPQKATYENKIYAMQMTIEYENFIISKMKEELDFNIKK